MKCPQCKKTTNSTDYCDNCGVLISSVAEREESEKYRKGMLKGGRSAFVAAGLSFLLPGLGQIYDAEYKKAFLILFGAIIGFWVFLIPGVIIWLYGIYDAYSVANKLNNGEISYRESDQLFLFGFVIIGIASIFFISIIFYSIVNPALYQLTAPAPVVVSSLPAAVQPMMTTTVSMQETVVSSSHRLTILAATYGAGARSSDATNWLSSKVSNNAVRIQVTNANIGSDPAYGDLKYLTVRYLYDGQEKTANITENQMLILP